MSATRTTLVAMVIVVLTFVSGVIVGVFADRVMMMHGHFGPPRARAQRFATHMLVNRLDRQLDLTDAQREQVQEILDKRHERVLALWSDVDPRVRAEIEGANADIVKVLTPEQKQKFEKLKLGIHGLHGKERSAEGGERRRP